MIPQIASDSLKPDSAARLAILPLLPVRVTLSQRNQNDSAANPAALRAAFDGRLSGEGHLFGEEHWDEMLAEAARALYQGFPTDALSLLQRAIRWKNLWEGAGRKSLRCSVNHWMILGACAFVMGEDDDASQFVLQARDCSGSQWADDLTQDFRDSHADATSFLSVVRLQQGQPEKARELLRHALEAHRHTGDLEQLAADYLILSICQELTGRPAAAGWAREEAIRTVRDRLDPERHGRRNNLLEWIRWYAHPRPKLMKSARLC